jgi:hypothetical protein
MLVSLPVRRQRAGPNKKNPSGQEGREGRAPVWRRAWRYAMRMSPEHWRVAAADPSSWIASGEGFRLWPYVKVVRI